MNDRPTHGYCPTCEEESPINLSGLCLWCDTPTVSEIPKKRGGWKRPDLQGPRFITEKQLRALHRLHTDEGISARELGRRIFETAGYATANSALMAILGGWRRLDLRSLPRTEAAVRSNIARRQAGSPGTADQRAYKRWRRKRNGGYRRCSGVRLRYPNKGAPCKHYALVGSDYCYAHDPARRDELLGKLAAAREGAAA